MSSLRTVLSTLALCTGAVSLTTPSLCGNDLEAGSLLIFPLIDSNPGRLSILTVTNTDPDFSNNIDIEFEFRDGNFCQKTSHLEILTAGDTFTVLASGYSFSTLEGYATVWAVSDQSALRNAVVKNTLIGTSSVIDALAQRTYSVNAIPFQGIGDGTVTDLDGDGERDLDGVEYRALPDRLAFPRFFGQQNGVESELVLLNLSGRDDSTAAVDFLIMNDDEEIFSSQFSFECWSRTPLLGISAIFDNGFLHNFTNQDPLEIIGAPGQESGWIEIDGSVVVGPQGDIFTVEGGLLGCMIETIGGESDATLPFGLGTQAGSTIGEDPCELQDLFEPNDTCASAFVVPSPGEVSLNGLTVQRPFSGPAASTDWFEVAVPGDHVLTIDASFIHAEVDIDLRLFDACGAILDVSQSLTDDESVGFVNNSPGTVTTQVRCIVSNLSSSDCGNYSLRIDTVSCLSIDDVFEDNDTCGAAVLRSANSTTSGLRCVDGDPDWWAVDVPAGSTQTVDLLHLVSDADLRLEVRSSCGGGANNLLTNQQTTTDNESFTFTNPSVLTETFFFGVRTVSPTSGICADYELEFSNVLAPGSFTPYCFGDGSLVDCPCGNNSNTGHPGGCAHRDGQGAILVGNGNPSLAADTLQFGLSSAASNSFALLLSGVNPLPQFGCIGCGIPEFDGLRCAGGSLRRLGSRAIDVNGNVINGWGGGAGPPGGIGLASSAIGGQTRRYFAFFRTDLLSTCFTGQNSSNAVAVNWTP